MALLDELRRDFAEHDVFLHLLLGLVSLARRLESVLPPEPAGGAPAPWAASPLNETEGPVLLLLGVISLRRNLLSTVEPIRAASTREASGPPASPTSLPSSRDLLR